MGGQEVAKGLAPSPKKRPDTLTQGAPALKRLLEAARDLAEEHSQLLARVETALHQQGLIPDDSPLLLTVHQAAKLISVGINQMYELVHRGTIPSVRLGPKIIRVPRPALEEWVRKSVINSD